MATARTAADIRAIVASGRTALLMGYQNAELDRLTDEARVTIDPGLREQLYRKAEHMVREDCVLVPLYHERFHAIATASVQGLRLHQTPPQVRYEELWIGS